MDIHVHVGHPRGTSISLMDVPLEISIVLFRLSVTVVLVLLVLVS